MGVKSYVVGILLVILVITTFGLLIQDLDDQNPTITVDQSNLSINNSWSQQIESSSQSIQSDFETIGDNKGLWFLDAAIAIPKVIVSVIILIFTSIGFGITFIAQALSVIGIPAPIAGLLVTIFFVKCSILQ